MSAMFKARAFSVQKPRFEDWVVNTGHDDRHLPQFSLGDTAAHTKSRELAAELGFDGYHYEQPIVGDLIEFLDSLGIDVECDGYNGKYFEDTDSVGRPVFPQLRNLLLWLLKHELRGQWRRTTFQCSKMAFLSVRSSTGCTSIMRKLGSVIWTSRSVASASID